MFLFDRATYSMDGMQVENVIDPGRASLMKDLLTYSSTMNKQNTFGWILETKDIMTYKINKYTKNRKVQQYNFAKEFRNSYYESVKDYIFMEEDVYYYYYPLLVFDVSKQNDRIIASRPDVTIKASFAKNIAQSTKCYCLILSENIVEVKDNRVKVVSI
uniref:Double jelly roll-like domain-containing protein n=1 Tax=Caenorhabditis japonica TaxID=281687 RepID=A0A8R1IQH4_CAEJA